MKKIPQPRRRLLPGSTAGALLQTLLLMAGLAVYVFLLTNRSLPLLRTLGIFTRYNFTLLAPLLVAAFTLAFTPDTRWGRISAFLLSLWVFGLSLTGLWASGQSEPGAASGLLPWTDAANYYHDALRLLEGFSFQLFSAWRPLFPALLAGLLGASGQNLQAVLGILVLIAGLSACALSLQVRYTHGSLAAAATLTLLFLYYRRFSGTTLSENLGFTLGCLGLALLWQGARQHKAWSAVAGLFSTALALNARPGPFFALAFMLVWGMRYFRRTSFVSWRFLGLGLAAILAAFTSNMLVQRQTTREPVVPFGNFTSALYGVATGGQGWTQFREDHPEVAALPDPERTLVSLQVIFKQFAATPEKALAGVRYNYSLLFSKSYYNLYAYVRGENDLVAEVVRLTLYALAAIGLLYGLIERKDALATLVSLSAIGVLLSAPFVPPGDAFGMRLYAAGIAVIILLPVMGSFFLLRRFGAPGRVLSPASQPHHSPALMVMILLTAAALLAPAAIGLARQPEQIQPVACPDGQTPVAYRLTPGSLVRVIREDTWQLDWMPEFHRGRFVRQIHNLPSIEPIEEFERIEGEFTLVSTIDLISGVSLLIVAPTAQLPSPPAVVRACGEWSANPAVRAFSFFYIRSTLE
ncbi:MAG: hypothetical protein HPY59_01280 [Anaerolineae bacterium]|nr:hypothetical protein [Anaerolineae bacterium]